MIFLTRLCFEIVYPGKQQRTVIHDNDVFLLVRLEQTFVFGPGNVLQRGVGFNVTLNNAG